MRRFHRKRLYNTWMPRLEMCRNRGRIEWLRPTWNVGIMEYWDDGFWRIGILLHRVNHRVKAWEKGGENR
jgi:hypothetical protein